MAEARDDARFEAFGATPVERGWFWIDDLDRAWLVECGKVDLFLVRCERGRPTGARHHVLRARQGEVILGLSADASAGNSFLANPLPGARVLGLTAARLRELAAGGLQVESARALLEGWIARMGEAAAAGAAPSVCQTLAPGSEYSFKEDTAIVPRRGVVWIRGLEGRARFLGETDTTPIGPDELFPVSHRGWLAADGGSRFEALSTTDFLGDDPDWQAVDSFQRTAGAALILRLQRSEHKERQRLERSGAEERERVDSVLRRLASPLRARQDARLWGDAGEGDPWLLAAQAIGRSLKIEFRRPPGNRREKSGSDPASRLATASGVRVRRVALPQGWHRQDSGPILGVLSDSDSPVALIPTSARSYEILDPAGRTVAPVNAKIAEKLEPFGYTFYRPLPTKKLRMWDLLRFGLAGCGRDLWMILLMGLAAGILGMVQPIATAIIFDRLIPGALRGELMQMTAILLVVAISAALFGLTRNFAMLRVEGRVDGAVQAAVWDRLMSLPASFFREYASGDLAMRGLGISQIRQILTGSVMSAVFSGVFSVFSYGLLFYYSWQLALVATGLIGAAFLTALCIGLVQLRYERDIAAIRGELAGKILRFINGIAKLRVSGTENRAFAEWAAKFARQRRVAVQSRKLSNWLTVFLSVFPVLSLMALFYVMARMLAQPGGTVLSTGQFLAFNAAFAQVLGAVLQVSLAVVSVLAVVPLYERARPILHAMPEVDEYKDDPGELAGKIEVNHLRFAYAPELPMVLRDVSLDIGAGQFVAVVGASGSGKSTLLRLLLGFEKPDSGSIFYDGQDLLSLDVRAVRQQIGVVLQGSKLLSGSIFQNIVGSTSLTIDDAWEAASLAGFDQDVKEMPMGMHTVISESGGGLSGGQRQRLMIARAIAGRPRILLFDEATSALDNETQATVSRSLEGLGTTRIVIAHRLSTIINADTIYVLDGGSIVQSGPYAELIAQWGVFAELAQRQLT